MAKPKEYKKTTLPNGLRIITVPQKETKAVTVLVLVSTGSKNEQKNISGISHFLEHMLFKGTKKRRNKIEIAEFLDKVGGSYNAFTGEEYTGYYAKVDSVHADKAMDWVSDIFLNSVFPAGEVTKERGVIIEEINMYRNNPMMYIDQVWKELLYGDQPAGWDIAGNKETVSKIGRKQILDYINYQYAAKHTVVCVAGNISEAEAIRKVKQYFKGAKKGNFKNKPEVKEAQSKSQVKIQFKKTDQTNLALGVRAYSMFHPKRYVFIIMSVILGGMMSSRLFEKVREQMGAAYYIRTTNDTDTNTGCLVTSCGVDNSKVEKVISAILKEYQKMATKKVGAAELKKAKDYVKGHMVLALESSDSKANFYGTQELLEKEILTPDEIMEKINKVSSDDILAAAKDIFKPEKLNLAMIGPFKDEKEFKRILKI
ncbi:MAG: pitrilysin family protein [Candidatus Pacebacteria bacterium]|nr:pitrilysin family protein [Candidatus Paceibacterota bacterium]